MSFNTRVTIIALLLLAGIGFLSWHYLALRHRPKPVVIVPRAEITLTIIPGWNLRDIAGYLVEQGVASTTADVYKVTGVPADPKDPSGGVEGLLAPETIRFFKGVSVDEVVKEFRAIRVKQITPDMQAEMTKRGITTQDLLTMASIVEEEAQTTADRKIVAGILWKRVEVGMPLQVDSSVHYAFASTGTVFTTDKQRATKSPWNTYLNKGLPPSPICMSSLESIMAALYPTKTSYWYFLSGTDGTMHYATTLEQHTANRYKYLK